MGQPGLVMAEKEVKEPKTVQKPEPQAVSAAELLALAADALDAQEGPRAPKHYRILAGEVRKLLERI